MKAALKFITDLSHGEIWDSFIVLVLICAMAMACSWLTGCCVGLFVRAFRICE